MDGNRRWAKERNLPAYDGHRAGLDKAKEVTTWAHAAGLDEVTLYAFSTENWKRDVAEVKYLITLIDTAFERWLDEFISTGGTFRVIGERERLPVKTRLRIEEAEAKSKLGTTGTLVLAISYGGRAEILNAVQTLLRGGKKQVTEDEFTNALWSAGLSDPGLIIRTGGEHRLSNFLTWQSVYSELMFTDTLWPAFSREEFEALLLEYKNRKRNFGV